MAGDIGVVTYIRVVEVRCGFGTIAIEYGLIKRRKGSHIGRLSEREFDYQTRKVYFAGIDMCSKFTHNQAWLVMVCGSGSQSAVEVRVNLQ